MPKEQGWAIASESGLYIGWWQTRAAAIAGHVHDKRRRSDPEVSRFALGRGLDAAQKAAWDECKKCGDRVVKVVVSYK